MNTQAIRDNSEQMEIYATLMAHSQGHENDHILACILASWQSGEGVFTDWLGLSEKGFKEMMSFHFPEFELDILKNPGQCLDAERFDERDELRQLLSSHSVGKTRSEDWMTEIVVNACQGQDHLWQDLGLWSRKDLTLLMQQNFPSLAARNDKDMKWKKFLYKQLCIAEGIYTCRAPSCQVCADYDVCFGPEE
jgi:nitrogen fixation protein NifQ